MISEGLVNSPTGQEEYITEHRENENGKYHRTSNELEPVDHLWVRHSSSSDLDQGEDDLSSVQDWNREEVHKEQDDRKERQKTGNRPHTGPKRVGESRRCHLADEEADPHRAGDG